MAVYNIQKTDNIIKSIVKRLINLQNGFTIKRRIGITTIYGVSLSPKPDAA